MNSAFNRGLPPIVVPIIFILSKRIKRTISTKRTLQG